VGVTVFTYNLIVVGLCGKVLVVEVYKGLASVRSCWKLPPCPIKPVPDGSKTDPLLVKACASQC